MSDSRLIPLGVITAPHGIRGQVKIRSFTADPEDLTSYGTLRDKNGKQFNITITSSTRDELIASVEGITTRNDAETLRNIELSVPRSALPAPAENEYYYEDLNGLIVQTADGKPYGVITAVHNFGAGDLINIKRVSGEEELVPFSKTTFPKIDIKNAVAVIEPPVVVSQ